jgi:hypothetical protein
MAGGDCDSVVGDWYWIYFIAPFCAALAVSEVTLLMDLDIEEHAGKAQTINKSSAMPENIALDILKNAQMDGSLSQMHNSFAKPIEAPTEIASLSA